MRRILLFTLVFIFAFTIPVFADDLFITNWNVDSNLLENGNLEVSEDITFRFEDDYNGVFRDIILDNTDGMDNLQVYEVEGDNLISYELNPDAEVGDSNVYATSTQNNAILVQVFSPSEDEDKTFRFEYMINNVAIVHDDIGEFYYKYLGDENETFIESFTASLSLPEFNQDEIDIFAHGPSHGTIEFRGNDQIILEIEDVESNNFIEARVLYPTSYTPLSNRSGNSDYQTIIDQEIVYQSGVEEEEARRESLRNNFNTISLIVSGVGALLIGFLYRLNRRNPKIFKEMDDVVPEDLSPAELNLFRNSTLTPRSITATIYDLARRGYLTIKDQNGQGKKLNLIFTKTDRYSAGLLQHEDYFMDWIFSEIGDGKRASTNEINTKRREASVSFNKNFHEWLKLVREDFSKRDYYDKSNRKIGVIISILGFIALVFGVVSIASGALYGIAVIVISLVVSIYGIIIASRLSDKGYIQKGLWDDFNKEIKSKDRRSREDISDKDLVYAVAMDNSVEDINSYRSGYPMSYFPLYWGYFFMLNNNGGSRVDDSVGNSFYGSTGASSSTGPSFGGGGGFSGGGGGGAGGGGAGGF